VIRRIPAGVIGAALTAALAFSTETASAAPELPVASTVGFTAARRQAGDSAWNSAVVRRLIGQAIERRAGWTRGGDLLDYRASARGHIYFLYDLGRGSERHLIKADQLALDLYWHAPDQTRQLIVGRRERKVLPTNIRYHLDHLTVVMDNFGDRIRMGEGSEVRDALHPAAPGALEFYDYRLADSLTLLMPGRQVQVYEVEVRPKDPRVPALVGAIYLDRATADIVKMEFTFTAASYIDDTVDYINVRLENAMWNGRYWLPYRQGIELRREFRLFDFPAGGIIRAEFRISDYRFNTGTAEAFFKGPPVAALPARTRRAYEFDEGLYDALDPEVAVTPPSMEEIREEATRIVARSYLQRVEGLKLAVPGVSSIFRFRRAEGLYVGPAVGRDYANGGRALWLGGYSLAAGRWQLRGRILTPLAGSYRLELSGYLNRVAEAARWQSSSGAVASLAALLDGEDYREPYWSSGGELALGRDWGPARARLSLAWEDWDSARLEAEGNIDRGYRDVRSLDDGDVARVALAVESSPVGAVEAVGGVTWEARLEAATLVGESDFEYVYAAVRAERFWPRLAVGTGLRVSGAAGAVGGGRIPAQRLLPLGGRGTVRGYPFHERVGNLYAAGGIELSRPLWYPFLSLDLFADIGWVGIEGNSAAGAAAVWNRVGEAAGSSRGPLVGVGAGVGFVFDILWIELARGVTQRGIWELVVRVRPEFWAWL
jgi:hypothetical protein